MFSTCNQIPVTPLFDIQSCIKPSFVQSVYGKRAWVCIFIQKQHVKFFPLTGYTFSFLITYVRVPRCINFLMTPCQVRVREKEKTHFKSPWKSIFISSLNLFFKLKCASFGHLLLLEIIFQWYWYYCVKEMIWI